MFFYIKPSLLSTNVGLYGQSEGFRNGVMLSLGALGYGAVDDGQVVLLLLLLTRCKKSGLRT